MEFGHGIEHKHILENRGVDRAIRGHDWNAVAVLNHIQTYERFVAKVNVAYQEPTTRVKIL